MKKPEMETVDSFPRLIQIRRDHVNHGRARSGIARRKPRHSVPFSGKVRSFRTSHGVMAWSEEAICLPRWSKRPQSPRHPPRSRRWGDFQPCVTPHSRVISAPPAQPPIPTAKPSEINTRPPKILVKSTISGRTSPREWSGYQSRTRCE